MRVTRKMVTIILPLVILAGGLSRAADEPAPQPADPATPEEPAGVAPATDSEPDGSAALPAAGTAEKVPGPEGKNKPETKADEVKCDIWTVNGYRLGMKSEEAMAVRAATPKSTKAGDWAEIEQDDLVGKLTFDAQGQLVMWEGQYVGADPEGIREVMLDRYGVPRKTDTAGQLRKEKGRRYYRYYNTIWQEPKCDARLVLTIGRPTKKGSPTVEVTLMAPPDRERLPEFKKKQAESWLD